MKNLSERPQNKNFGKYVKSTNARLAKERESKYYENPLLCQQCNRILPYLGNKKFCSHSCSATHSNKTRKHTDETKRKISEALIKRHDMLPKKIHKSRRKSQRKNPKFSRIQYVNCKLCNNEFYVKHHKNIKNDICSDCLTVEYTLLHNNTCACCNVLFVSRAYKKYCNNCSPNIRHYRTRAKFLFNVYEYPDEFDVGLIDEYGWYSPNGYKRRNKTPNLSGVSRDHLYTVAEGYKNNINPKLLAHPANCKILLHDDNNRKNSNSSISLDELEKRILAWDAKYL